MILHKREAYTTESSSIAVMGLLLLSCQSMMRRRGESLKLARSGGKEGFESRMMVIQAYSILLAEAKTTQKGLSTLTWRFFVCVCV